MIYFIEAVGAGLLKIGFTERDVMDRLGELQTASPHKLRVLTTLAGGQPQEAAFHNQFSHLRVAGEWFKLDDELRVFVCVARMVLPRVDELRAELADVRRRLEARVSFYDSLLFPQFGEPDGNGGVRCAIATIEDCLSCLVKNYEHTTWDHERRLHALDGKRSAVRQDEPPLAFEMREASDEPSARSLCGDCRA